MALTTEDRSFLEDRFERIYNLIEKNREAADRRMNDHSTKIFSVGVEAVKAVVGHEEKHHDPVKKWGVIAALASIASAIGGGIAWALSKIGGGEK